MCDDPVDGSLLQQLDLHGTVLPSGLAERIRGALDRSRAQACMFQARILRMESEQIKKKECSTECHPIKVRSASGVSTIHVHTRSF
jgi:hypothetical protein